MKIFGIGMNYLQHNKELDGTLYKTEEPVVFTKPDSALLKNGKPFFIPDWMGRVDYEAELVVRISKMNRNIAERFAHRYYDAVTVGIDFTARDLQRRLRQQGQPWDLSKGFDGAAVLGQWVPVEQLPDAGRLHFHLDINGQTVQQGFSGDMVFSIDQIIAYVSRFCTLKTGDLIYTGTPAGTGPVNINDHLTGFIEGRKVLEFNCK